jgi:hypothetical protein
MYNDNLWKIMPTTSRNNHQPGAPRSMVACWGGAVGDAHGTPVISTHWLTDREKSDPIEEMAGDLCDRFS